MQGERPYLKKVPSHVRGVCHVEGYLGSQRLYCCSRFNLHISGGGRDIVTIEAGLTSLASQGKPTSSRQKSLTSFVRWPHPSQFVAMMMTSLKWGISANGQSRNAAQSDK